MVDSFVREESDFIKSLRNELFLTPINIPVIFLGLFILTINKSLLNTINKESFKFKLRTKVKNKIQVKRIMIFFDILSKVFRHCSFN
jgi:hypothetical protein